MELDAQLRESLGQDYTIERELGPGGMARVFVAKEVALGRRVVIKVLPPEMASVVLSERFRREISLAAQLRHPHIIPVLTAGGGKDLLYYTMPFVEGETLRSRLDRNDAIPLREGTRIVREIADALAYAHGQGIVHRDIKPDNILIENGHAVVADLGVAKALASAAGTKPATVLSLPRESSWEPRLTCHRSRRQRTPQRIIEPTFTHLALCRTKFFPAVCRSREVHTR